MLILRENFALFLKNVSVHYKTNSTESSVYQISNFSSEYNIITLNPFKGKGKKLFGLHPFILF